MTTKKIGDISTLAVMQAAIRRGWDVSIPFGDSSRYDLIFDAGKLLRVQVKTGKLVEGTKIRFSTSSSDWRNGRKRKYVGEVDAFAVFCPDVSKVFLVPIAECDALWKVMWISQPKNKQSARVLYAKDFEF